MTPPLFRALAQLRRERSYGALSLYLLCALVSVYLVLLSVSPPIQRTLMRNFHLRTSSYAAWAVQQVVPNMYSFKNELLLEIPMQEKRYVNHYPIQLVTNLWNRNIYFWNYGHTVLRVRSTYRGVRVVTRYRLVADPKDLRIDMEIIPDEMD